jgi:hypothetical protein
LTLKAVHIPGRTNVIIDRLICLEMSRDYYINDEVFQRIQWVWKCYPKVNLFASKSMRESQKNLLKNVFEAISINIQGK